ncbi:MAG: PAS domain S-box protein [Bacteroidales bacterium]|jgi:PAS domain S-box-containing protein
MEEANLERKNQKQDWQRVDARVLGQILAFQNVLFVLPDQAQIAEFFSEALKGLPGVTDCFVCLEDLTAPVGITHEICNECLYLRMESGVKSPLPFNYPCKLAALQNLLAIRLGTLDHTFGFFILRTDSNGTSEPYLPFLHNLAGYVALSLENRIQKLLLENVRNDLEFKVEERTGELMALNAQLEEEIQERRSTEETLSDKQQVFRTLVENSPDIIARYDRDCKRTYVNPTYLRVAGISQQDLLNTSPVQCSPLPANEATVLENLLHKVLKSGVAEAVDIFWPMAGNPDRWFNIYASPEFDREGQVISVMTVSRDITQRMHAYKLLRKDAERGNLLLELYKKAPQLSEKQLYDYALEHAVQLTDSKIGFFHLISDDQQGVILTTWNSEALKNCTAVYHNHYPIENAGNWVDCVRLKRPVIYNDFANSPNQKGLPEGHSPVLRFMSIPVMDGDKVRIIFGVGNKAEDYNEFDMLHLQLIANELHKIIVQRRAEEALQESEARYRTLFHGAAEGILVADIGTKKFLYANPAQCRMLGYAKEELEQMTIESIHPEKDLNWILNEFMAQARGEKTVALDIPCLCKNGTILYADILTTPMVINGLTCNVGFFSDNTERHKAKEEIRKLNLELEKRVVERTSQLEAANKELETFAYSVSHDLRAPLRAIDGFSHALLEDYQDKIDTQGKNYLQRVRLAAQRMAQLIDDLLSLSRLNRSEMNIQQVNLSKMFREIADDLHRSQPGRKVRFMIEEGIIVLGDGRLLRVVLENLIGNAWKFTSKHPVAAIEFGLMQQTEGPVYFIRDDGAGFDMNYANKLFGAFQRLHSESEFQGTGIGLATVQRIIHRHGGKVWAEGEVEKGTRIYFTIP